MTPDRESLLDQLLTELRERWWVGDHQGVEGDLERHPSIAAVPGHAAALIFQELKLRRTDGDGVQLEDYLRKYPSYADELRHFDEADRLLGPSLAPFDPEQWFGDYLIRRKIGQGGMGTVYLAYEPELDREVALKTIRSTSLATADEMRRFYIEATASAHLDHPNIVQVYKIGESHGYIFIALKYIKGNSLSQALKEYREDPRAAARLVSKVARAIHHAHERGILHRDLKPSNILLNERGEPFVADFGLAKRVDQDSDLTRTGDVIGTPAYMPPEQVQGRRGAVTTAVDVFGLGGVLYELLTGRPPFRGGTVFETLSQVVECNPQRPSGVNRAVARDLETICLKCLHKDPQGRYRSAEALAEDLDRWSKGEPIQARRVSLGERAVKWARRKPAVAALIATLAPGVPFVLGYYAWDAARWRQANAEAMVQGERLDSEKKLSQTRYYYALFNQISKSVSAPRPGWRAKALEDLAEAARLPMQGANVLELRGLAARCLGGVDLTKEGILASGFHATRVAFSPDGKRLAVGQSKGFPYFSVRIFDVASRSEIQSYRIVHLGRITRNGVTSLAFSPEGRWLTAGMRSGKIYAWDTDHSEADPILLAGHTGPVTGLAYVGRSTLISGGADRRLWLWDIGAGGKGRGPCDVGASVECLVVSPDAKQIACGGPDGVRLVDLSSLLSDPSRASVTEQYGYPHKSVRFSPNGRSLAFSQGSTILLAGFPIYKTENRRTFQEPELGAAHEGEIGELEFDASGSLLVSTSTDGTIKLWEVASGQMLLSTTVFSEGDVYPAFSSDRKSLAVGTSEGTHLYRLKGLAQLTTVAHDPRVVRSFTFLHSGGRWGDLASVTEMQISADNTTVGELSRWDTRDGKNVGVRSIDVSTGDARVHARVVPHPERPVLACNRYDEILLWEPDRLASIRHLKAGFPSSLAFSRDGKRLWAILAENEVNVWEFDSLASVSATWANHLSKVTRNQSGLRCLDAGNRGTLVGSADGFAYLLRSRDCKEERRWGADGSPVHSVALSPDESLALLGTQKGTVRVVRVSTGEVVDDLESHSDRVNSVVFSPDGRWLATGSKDKTSWLYCWEGTSFKKVVKLESPSGRPIVSVRFNTDGTVLGMLLQNEHAVRLWHLDRLRSGLASLGLGLEGDVWTGRAPLRNQEVRQGLDRTRRTMSLLLTRATGGGLGRPTARERQ